MYIKRNISWALIIRFAWLPVTIFMLYAGAVFTLYFFLELTFIDIPWEPLSIIGIAVSFYLGFKNSQSYDRFWEGRKIWGGIVNYSRTWAIQVISFVRTNDPEQTKRLQREMIYRQIAWINSLRIQLRQPRPWSVKQGRAVERLINRHGERNPSCEAAQAFLSNDEYEALISKVNTATHIVKNQAKQITDLKDQEIIDGFQEDQLHSCLEEFYNLQGKAERIKNTPFPRQYGYFSKIFVYIFIALIPFGLLNVFEMHIMAMGHDGHGEWLIFLQIPMAVVISWIFYTMEMIGDNSEDPFDGRINDVPMTALCRTIEIDLRDMLDEKDLPEPIKAQDNILY